MASVKNYIHYHDNMNTLNKITEENLKEMIKECVEEIIGEYIEVEVNNIIDKKLEGFATKEDLEIKVDKVEGKGLSQNDFTDEEKQKLIILENYDDTELNKALNELSATVKGMEGNQGEVNLEGLATIDYVNECLGEKKLVYLTEAEYEALSDEEKGRDGIVYNIITNDML